MKLQTASPHYYAAQAFQPGFPGGTSAPPAILQELSSHAVMFEPHEIFRSCQQALSLRKSRGVEESQTGQANIATLPWQAVGSALSLTHGYLRQPNPLVSADKHN